MCVRGRLRPGSYKHRLLEALAQGPVPLNQAYAMAGTKKTAWVRIGELREEGLIETTITLTEHGRKALKAHGPAK